MFGPETAIIDWRYSYPGPKLELTIRHPTPGNGYGYEPPETITLHGDEARAMMQRLAPKDGIQPPPAARPRRGR